MLGAFIGRGRTGSQNANHHDESQKQTQNSVFHDFLLVYSFLKIHFIPEAKASYTIYNNIRVHINIVVQLMITQRLNLVKTYLVTKYIFLQYYQTFLKIFVQNKHAAVNDRLKSYLNQGIYWLFRCLII